MAGRSALAVFSACTLTLAARALAETLVLPVSISAGPLPYSLQNLQRQTGIELLFDSASIRGLQSPAIHGDLSAEAALGQLLTQTNLTVRRAASGAWIIERPAAAPLARPDALVPEILVVGQRTQNADIRRFEDDVQPYTVVLQKEIVRAHRDNIEQLFASRITSNTQTIPPGLAQDGSTLSEIDLRGLGSQGTLVLVDGRRMPTIPLSYTEFRQSDVNAIPLHAIERIEILTGAAGGIHGFGALGGVVNVILDRDSRGLDLHLTQGITSRGDSPRHGVEARYGKTSGDGATDLVLFAAHTQGETPLVGERIHALRDRLQTFDLVPELYRGIYPNGNSIAIRSLLRVDEATGEFEIEPDLVFKPELGGATLPSHETFLPVGFSGNAQSLVAALTQNAGRLDISLPDDEAAGDLGSNPRSNALLANLRHRFAPGFEAYLDALVLRGRGESHGDSLHTGLGTGDALLAPESPANPFTDYIDVSFPIEQVEEEVWKKVESTRYTAGFVSALPLGWRGTAEIGFGSFRSELASFAELAPEASLLFLIGDPSDLDTNPLGDWTAFQRAIAERSRTTLRGGFRTRFRDQSLRLAGPLFSTTSGPATLTLLAERRKEDVPAYTEFQIRDSSGTTTVTETALTSRSTATTSYYAELHTPLFDEAAPAALLRKFELQVAVRRDVETDDFARDPRAANPDFTHARFSGTAYTLGAKISPTPWLMLRGSYATGEQPPPLSTLIELDPQMSTLARATDAKRGDTDLGADGAYLLRWGGNENLKTVHASTVFLGAVLRPLGEDGPRFALDFSRIRRTRDVSFASAEEIMAHEDEWPERVMRAPLTDADRANGYLAGPVTMIDTRYSNGAARDVDTLDARVEWPLRFLGGRLQLYADATYHMHNAQREPFQAEVQWAGYRGGPLKWRANGGFDWSRNEWTLGANLQHFGRSLIITQGPLAGANELDVQLQGSRRIPSQTYLDLYGTWELPLRNIDLTVDLGIVNVLDAVPPRESTFVSRGPGYSRYGDPRQRRFELGMSCHF